MIVVSIMMEHRAKLANKPPSYFDAMNIPIDDYASKFHYPPLSHWNIFDIIFPKRKQGNHATYLPSIPKPGYVPAPNTAEYDDFSTSHLNASSVSAVPLNYLQVDSLPSSNLILSTEGTASSRQSQGVPFYQSFINFVDENQFRVQKYCGLLFVLLFGFIFIIVLITIIRGLIRSDEPFSQLEDEA